MKKTLFSITFALLYIISLGQTMEYEKFEQISIKKAKQLIIEEEGRLDQSLTKRMGTNVYELKNGKGLVVYEKSHAFLHPSIDNIKKFDEAISKMSLQPTHILEGKFNYKEDFLLKADSKKLDFLKQLGYKNTTVSLNDLIEIDALLVKQLKINYTPEKYFAGFVALLGSCMIKEVNDGQWIMVKNRFLNKIWEPYIVDNKQVHYNPFLIAYKELYEYFPTEKTIHSYDHILIELKMPISPLGR